jgi:hypothetical protein
MSGASARWTEYYDFDVLMALARTTGWGYAIVYHEDCSIARWYSSNDGGDIDLQALLTETGAMGGYATLGSAVVDEQGVIYTWDKQPRGEAAGSQ